jgi:hypothetical protein
MFFLNGKPLNIDSAFEFDGTSYPSNWLRLTSDEEKAAIGITWVDDAKPYDTRFYISYGVEKDLDLIKSEFIASCKFVAKDALSRTDWAVTKKIEIGGELPESIASFRTATRAELARLKTAIMEAPDLATLVPIVENQNWPSLT